MSRRRRRAASARRSKVSKYTNYLHDLFTGENDNVNPARERRPTEENNTPQTDESNNDTTGKLTRTHNATNKLTKATEENKENEPERERLNDEASIYRLSPAKAGRQVGRRERARRHGRGGSPESQRGGARATDKDRKGGRRGQRREKVRKQ